jgi:hypothetical protein
VTILDELDTVVATLTPPRLEAELEALEEAAIEEETGVVGEGEEPEAGAEGEGDEAPAGDAGGDADSE